MTVYYVILGYLLYLGLIKKLSEKYKHSDSIIVAVAAVILFFFAAMRGVNIGADTEQYCSHFLKLMHTRWIDFPSYTNSYYGGLEPGYKVYNKLLSIFVHPQTITIANSVIQILLIFILIIKQSKNKWLSIYLYFTFCFFQTAMNLTPSSYVSYFLFLSFPFIKDKKLVKFLAFIGIGMMFHTSAIFFLPLYFLSKIEINKRTMTLACGGSALLFIFYTLILQLLTYVLPEKYIPYIDTTKEHKGNTVELLVLLVQIVALVYCYLRVDKDKRRDIAKENAFLFWMLLYESLLYLLSVNTAIFQRGAFLFSPYFIIMIPGLISHISDERRRKITTIAMILYGTAIYILRVSINNVGKTIPYEFFFNQ